MHKLGTVSTTHESMDLSLAPSTRCASANSTSLCLSWLLWTSVVRLHGQRRSLHACMSVDRGCVQGCMACRGAWYASMVGCYLTFHHTFKHAHSLQCTPQRCIHFLLCHLYCFTQAVHAPLQQKVTCTAKQANTYMLTYV